MYDGRIYSIDRIGYETKLDATSQTAYNSGYEATAFGFRQNPRFALTSHIRKTLYKIPKTVRSWLGCLSIILLVEKVIQHVVVTVSFFYNTFDIRSKVAIDYNFLMVSGAIVAALFAIALWATVKNKKWGIILASALAMFDIVGEFVAQGKIQFQ